MGREMGSLETTSFIFERLKLLECYIEVVRASRGSRVTSNDIQAIMPVSGCIILYLYKWVTI